MLSRIWIANFLLVLIAIFLSIKAYEIWSNGERMNSGISTGKKSISHPVKAIGKKEIPPGTDYEVVVQKNLFWPDRLESEPQKPEQKTKVEPKADGKHLRRLEKDIELTNLYGVIIVDDRKEALINEIPVGRRGILKEGRQIKRAKVGDTVGRFKVKEIRETNVLLSAGGREWQVSLFDIDKPKKRGRAKKKTGPVVIGVESKAKTLVAKGSAKGKERPPEPAASKRKTLPKAQEKKRSPSAPDRTGPERR